MKLGLQPDWIEDLLGLWAASDAGAVTRKLAWSTASPMFAMWGVVDNEVEQDGSYSAVEVNAVRSAIERLRNERPDMWEAVLATFKPWAGIEANAGTLALAKEAGPMLAAWVDEIVEG